MRNVYLQEVASIVGDGREMGMNNLSYFFGLPCSFCSGSKLLAWGSTLAMVICGAAPLCKTHSKMRMFRNPCLTSWRHPGRILVALCLSLSWGVLWTRARCRQSSSSGWLDEVLQPLAARPLFVGGMQRGKLLPWSLGVQKHLSKECGLGY